MARYQMILAYDGTRFKGSQRQANARTVQSEFERALRTLGWSGRSILMAGRTDTGVHATGQVVAFDFDWQHTDEELLRALNSELPADMAARAAKVAADDFHPRFDAISRRYVYRLFCQPIRDPLRENMAWRVWPAVNGSLLEQTAALFLGSHDFAAFGSPTSAKGTTIRAVMKAKWRSHADEWQFEIQADAFLYRMVRRLVFVQVAVAQGKCSAEAVARSLAGQLNESKRSEIPAGLAPAHGLNLVEVTY
ncbi:MAG TPA: tRNA pseudouridine(38-40) synthase TruA [Anaerolineales bacterium]|nr:tRNA pseudouridine(38-40) synthase TruA [Anaerolineales bacterium]